MAMNAAMMASAEAIMNTGCQFPFAAMILVKGTSIAAVPFAVYMKPVVAVA